jgi:hypothetical protein
MTSFARRRARARPGWPPPSLASSESPRGSAWPICRVGRDPQADLIAEGADGLRRLAAAADSLLTRHGGTSCTLQKTCMPLVSLYRRAAAVELLTRPLGSADVTETDTPAALAPDAVEFVADTDTLLTMCACSASSDQPY